MNKTEKRIPNFKSSFVKDAKSNGFHPAIKINSKDSKDPFVFWNKVEKTEQKARRYAMHVYGKFRDSKSNNKEAFSNMEESEKVDEAVKFFRKWNIPKIIV